MTRTNTVEAPPGECSDRHIVALVGNPNAGKTTLFNQLTGLRAQTANFPGTTLELRRGSMETPVGLVELIDMPGLYSLAGVSSEERVATEALSGRVPGFDAPSAIVLLVDATNLIRNLYLASQVLELGSPVVIALNLCDVAEGSGLEIDHKKLAELVGCPVIATAARSGRGVPELRRHLDEMMAKPAQWTPRCPAIPAQENMQSARYAWAEALAERCIVSQGECSTPLCQALDKITTHAIWGVGAFIAAMFAVFYLIFSLASVPMDMIDSLFGEMGGWIARHMAEGPLRSLLVDGVIGGVGGVLVFLPQICILFFILALLEDSGYLARAAFVMDRIMNKVGLPGKAFVPMLSAHACAVPAIMATRVIENKKDRFITILIIPLLTCSARLPVYAMVAALLFPSDSLKASGIFWGGYALGIVAALIMAAVFRRTLFKGRTAPLAIELPNYRLPSLKNALVATWDRSLIFVKKAGTVILAISVVLWWLATYPRLDAADMPPRARAAIEQFNTEADAAEAAGRLEAAGALRLDAANREAQAALAHSFAGRLGRFVEPVMEPLGFNWQIGVGVVCSFAAREVIVSTLSIVYGVGEAGAEDAGILIERLRKARREDGSPLFTVPVALSLLVFYVLAMQCLPTQAITRREMGSWKWAGLQLGYMTVLAYSAAFIVFHVATALGW